MTQNIKELIQRAVNERFGSNNATIVYDVNQYVIVKSKESTVSDVYLIEYTNIDKGDLGIAETGIVFKEVISEEILNNIKKNRG